MKLNFPPKATPEQKARVTELFDANEAMHQEYEAFRASLRVLRTHAGKRELRPHGDIKVLDLPYEDDGIACLSSHQWSVVARLSEECRPHAATFQNGDNKVEFGRAWYKFPRISITEDAAVRHARKVVSDLLGQHSVHTLVEVWTTAALTRAQEIYDGFNANLEEIVSLIQAVK